MNPTARSMRYFKDRGYIVARVEQRLPIPGMFITLDAFGFGDLLVASPGFGIALVQSTTFTNLKARQKKAKALPEFRKWRHSGGKVIFHGWVKRGPRGKRKTWQLAEDVFDALKG